MLLCSANVIFGDAAEGVSKVINVLLSKDPELLQEFLRKSQLTNRFCVLKVHVH